MLPNRLFNFRIMTCSSSSSNIRSRRSSSSNSSTIGSSHSSNNNSSIDVGGIEVEWDISAPVPAGSVNLFGENINSTMKNREALLDAVKEPGLEERKRSMCQCLFIRTKTKSQYKDGQQILQK
jgi:hypothetical protein